MASLRRFLTVVAAGLLSAALCSASSAEVEAQSSSVPAPNQPAATREPSGTVIIPGPLRSFLRMAGISQEAAPGDVLPLLARNVFQRGRIGLKETEYLTLIDRYVKLAKEIEALTDPDGILRVADCSQASKLIHVLGYKFEHGCSRKDASLITEDAEVAFLTSDSGFPITALEEALQTGTPFSYSFPATRVPILFTENDWLSASTLKQKAAESLLDLILHDAEADRLYSAMARSDPETRLALFHSPGLKRLMPVAATFDFYGSNIAVRSGAVVLPAGANANKDWEELVGASPQSPGDFALRLLAKDHGWLAAYFDALSRVSPEQQIRLTEGDQLKRFYDAYRSFPSATGSAVGVFPGNDALLLLFTRLRWDANGNPEVPGNPGVWREILAREAKVNGGTGWAKRIPNIETPNRLLEELVTVANFADLSSPIQVYLALSAIDSAREPEAGMSAATVRLLGANFRQLNKWYSIFAEFPALDDAAITDFVNAANRISAIQDPALRSNALGAFQAEIGLWQILARQKEIPNSGQNAAWEAAIKPYGEISSSVQLFDAARTSLKSILSAVGKNGDFSQDQVVDLLAGPSPNTPGDQLVHQALSDRMRAVLDDQRLVSIDTLFALYDGLDDLSHGKPVGDKLLSLAQDLREFEMPRPIFTGGEKASWAPVVYTSRHAELQVRTDLDKIIRTPASAAQLEAARGRLTPFLRDTLVGLNYAYYEPPGAEVMHNNPLFVRSHDFTIISVEGDRQLWGAPQLIGVGVTAGGGAYLMGSLADLPYALATTEEDFIAPQKVQALIWKETVPEMLVGAILPRWWGINRNELHAVGLYQRAGEELLMASAQDAQLRERVLKMMSASIPRARVAEIEEAIEQNQNLTALLAQISPAEKFNLAAGFRREFSQQASLIGPANRELDELSKNDPGDTDTSRLSSDFGMPHPTLEGSNSLSLLDAEEFPAAAGESSRLFGESWDSENLYWARLADEMGYSPAMLNLLAPELTRHMIANIFGTSIDDWPALLRAMEETGNEFRQGKISIPGAVTIAANGSAGNGSQHGNE